MFWTFNLSFDEYILAIFSFGNCFGDFFKIWQFFSAIIWSLWLTPALEIMALVVYKLKISYSRHFYIFVSNTLAFSVSFVNYSSKKFIIYKITFTTQVHNINVTVLRHSA